MYDVTDASKAPSDGDLYAGYVDGNYVSYPGLVARFNKIIVPIAVFPTTNAGTVLDIENGDARPDEAPTWARLRRNSGKKDVTCYMSEDIWNEVQLYFIDAHEPEPIYWVANYDDVAVIPAGAIAKQYASVDDYDTSVVADFWPGVDTEGDDMLGLNDTDRARYLARKLSWRYLGRGPRTEDELTTWANTILVNGLDAGLTLFVDSPEHHARLSTPATQE